MWFTKHATGNIDDACKAFKRYAVSKDWQLIKDFGFHDTKDIDYIYLVEHYDSNEYHLVYIVPTLSFFEDKFTKKLRMNAENHMDCVLDDGKVANIYIDIVQIITKDNIGLVKMHQFPHGLVSNSAFDLLNNNQQLSDDNQ